MINKQRSTNQYRKKLRLLAYSLNHKCKCGKLISNKAKNCKSCATKIRFKITENVPAYKHGKWSKKHKNFCTICYKKIVPLAKLCQACYLKRIKGKNHPNYIDGRTNKKYYCRDCGKEINSATGIKGKKRCLHCANLKSKNPNWLGGSSFEPYSLTWTEELRKHIRKRDNYACQNCDMTEEEHLVKYKKVLSVHHIDYDKQNSKENNLITLCHICNIFVNANRDYWYAYFTYLMEKK